MTSRYNNTDVEIEEFLKLFETVPLTSNRDEPESDSEYCLISMPENVSLEMFNNVKISMNANLESTQVSEFHCEFEKQSNKCLLPQIILKPLVQNDNDETIFFSSSLKCKLKCTKLVSSCFEDKRLFVQKPSVPPLPKPAKQRSVLFGSSFDSNQDKNSFTHIYDDGLHKMKSYKNQELDFSSDSSKSNIFENVLQKKDHENCTGSDRSVKKKKMKRKLYTAPDDDVLQDEDILVRKHKKKKHKHATEITDEGAVKEKKAKKKKKKRKHGDSDMNLTCNDHSFTSENNVVNTSNTAKRHKHSKKKKDKKNASNAA